jgi:hypothetical protein
MSEFNNSLTVALNKVCFSSDFKMFFTARHGICPSGLTVGVEGESEDNYLLFLDIRHYGYESSSNRGTSIYDDLQDYMPGKLDFTEEHLNTVKEYFMTRKPELYDKYMKNVIFTL